MAVGIFIKLVQSIWQHTCFSLKYNAQLVLAGKYTSPKLRPLSIPYNIAKPTKLLNVKKQASVQAKAVQAPIQAASLHPK